MLNFIVPSFCDSSWYVQVTLTNIQGRKPFASGISIEVNFCGACD